MSAQLEIETQINGPKMMAKLKGQIDEDSDFSKIKNLGLDEYYFDFENVNMINSCGIREWINLIESLGTHVQITYQKCPQIIIDQLNMVHGFVTEKIVVESFFAPYYSEKEDREYKILLASSQVQGGKAPEMKTEDGEVLEFDAIEEQYFNFLKRAKTV